MPPGEEVALQPALAEVFGEHLHHATVVGEVFVGGQGSGLPRLAGGVVEGVEPVGGGLVGADHAEVPAPGGRGHDALQEAAEHLGRFVEGGAGPVDGHGVVREIGQREVAQEPPAVGVRGGAEAGLALGHTGEDLRGGAAFAVEQFLRPVGAQPGFQLPQVLRVVADAGERDLVGAPGVLDGEAVDLLGSGPALGGAQDDHGPGGPFGDAVLACRPLVGVDAVQGGVHGGGEGAVDGGRVVAGDEQRVVPVAAQQPVQFLLGDPGQDRRVGDLVAVEVEDRQDGPVVDRVEELVRVPGRGERPRLRLAVADHAGDEEVRVVEGGAVGVGEGVAEFAALVDGAGGLGCDVAGHAAGEGELLEQPPHARRVAADVRIRVGVAALQPGVGEDGGAAVAGSPDAEGGPAAPLDHPVEVGVDEIEPRRGAPVAEQPRLDVLGDERPGQQGVVHQVDLADGEVVGRAPVRVERGDFVVGQGGGGGGGRGVAHGGGLLVGRRWAGRVLRTPRARTRGW